jgi:hypothetical protein
MAVVGRLERGLPVVRELVKVQVPSELMLSKLQGALDSKYGFKCSQGEGGKLLITLTLEGLRKLLPPHPPSDHVKVLVEMSAKVQRGEHLTQGEDTLLLQALNSLTKSVGTMTVELLRESKVGVAANALGAKHPGDEVRTLARTLVQSWREIYQKQKST